MLPYSVIMISLVQYQVKKLLESHDSMTIPNNLPPNTCTRLTFPFFRVEWPPRGQRDAQPRDQRDAQRHSGHQDSDCQWQPRRKRGRVNSSVFSKLHDELSMEYPG